MSDLVRIENLQVVRSNKTICSVPQLAIEAGERLLIRGSNGSGKTTLLRVLAGLTRDHAGNVQVEIPRIERVYVHQNPRLFHGTVLFNACYGLKARGGDGVANEQSAMHWLEKFGVVHLAGASAKTLSGGECRRVSLARALAIKPRLLLLDEPFADLDDAGQRCLIDAINSLAETTFVIASPIEIPTVSGSRLVSLTAKDVQ